jgi:hypothetical protein
MKRIFLFIPLIFLSACAAKKPVVLAMPPAVMGTVLSPEDMASVRYDENVKAYEVSRYIDPNDSLVMHEAHTIYRVETTAKWNLHPNAPVDVPGGPVVGIIDTAHKDSPITPEIVAEVDRQQAATQTLLAQSQRLNLALKQLSRILPATEQVAEQNAQLKVQVLATERRLEILEDQFRKQQQEAQQQQETEIAQPVAPSVNETNDW